jgi:1-pyrroline-5-carboxylate dehydrogenase
MLSTIMNLPRPTNEPVKEYRPGSPERQQIDTELDRMLGSQLEIPLVIGGRAVTTGRLGEHVCPHDHRHVLARFHQGSSEHVEQAVAAAAKAYPEWSMLPWQQRLGVFRKAADLLATSYRPILTAATMLGQSKTVREAEIDAACELVDFYRFNPHFAAQIMAEQPESSAGTWDYVDYRPLEGFVLAVTPFNFTAIAGNLPTAPAMMGNTVIWKPASSAITSAYFIMKLLEQAGLPPGVINLVPGPGAALGDAALAQPGLAGVHFTGSTGVFQRMWGTIGSHIARYKSYPRIVGETGGKDFIFAHPSADPEVLITAAVRGAFEYQGQKCSAASRLYVPESLWRRIERRLAEQIRALDVGDPCDFHNFMGAVIDRHAFDEIKGYIDFARASADAELVVGGECDDRVGYFVRPTLVRARTPDFKLMQEEIFGPVLTVYVYPDHELEQTLELCDRTSPYALTGAIVAQDRAAIEHAMGKLRHAAGNLYINDKPTGAVVGQQPFGGGRASGTNDKAGSALNLLRWVSPRAIKENFVPPRDYRYPFMAVEAEPRAERAAAPAPASSRGRRVRARSATW